jgi:antitoxin (DNA-binding transcriptional repressor) of toxin-antitoxin stability system
VELVITRGDAPVARVTGVRRPTVALDLEALRAFRETLPAQEMSAGELVRWMRDTDRY